MIRSATALALLAFLSGAAAAADATVPVKVLFDIATGKVEGELFDDKRLDGVFSQSFARTYRIAHKVAEMAESEEMLFDYDPLIGGQDSCPLEDISMKALAPEKAGDITVTPVEVQFFATRCFQGFEKEPPAKRRFRVIEEDGRFVIDDYENGVTDDKEKPVSVKEQLVGFADGDIRRSANLTVPAE